MEFSKEVAEPFASRGPAENILASELWRSLLNESLAYILPFGLELETAGLKMSKVGKLKTSKFHKSVGEGMTGEGSCKNLLGLKRQNMVFVGSFGYNHVF